MELYKRRNLEEDISNGQKKPKQLTAYWKHHKKHITLFWTINMSYDYKSSQNWNSDQSFVDRPPTTRQHLISVIWASFSIILWTLSKIIWNKYLESNLHESWKECFQNFTSTTFFTRSNVYTWIQLYIHTYSTDLNEA